MIFEYESYVPPNSNTEINISLLGDHTKYYFLECLLKNSGFDVPNKNEYENKVEIIPYKTHNYYVIFYLFGLYVADDIKTFYNDKLNISLEFDCYKIYGKHLNSTEIIISELLFDNGFSLRQGDILAIKSYLHNIVSNYLCNAILTMNKIENAKQQNYKKLSIKTQINLFFKKISRDFFCDLLLK